jgi:hypothetical protein
MGVRRIARLKDVSDGASLRTLSDSDERMRLRKLKRLATALSVGLLLSRDTPLRVEYSVGGVAESL